MRQYGMHTRQGARLFRVNGANFGISMRAGQQGAMQHAVQVNIGRKNRFSLSQLDPVHFRLGLTHHAGGSHFCGG